MDKEKVKNIYSRYSSVYGNVFRYFFVPKCRCSSCQAEAWDEEGCNIVDFNELLTTFANNLLPILLISGAGFLLGKTLSIESRSLGRVVFYIFSPILVFDLLLHTELSGGEMLATLGYTVLISLLIGMLAFLAKGIVLAVIVGLFESVIAKSRLFNLRAFFILAFSLAFVTIVFELLV